MVTLDNRGIPADQPHEAGRRLASQLLAAPGPRPEVLVCQNDDWAHGALAACAAAGLRVPEEIAVTGFDGSPLSAGGLAPLTTVVQPCREMAIRAVELLLGRIRGKARGGVPREIKLPCQVLVRQSCGAAWRATPASVSPNITRNKKEKAT
jgi:DNA-binding LacI/PurR family transcriptional regulator